MQTLSRVSPLQRTRTCTACKVLLPSNNFYFKSGTGWHHYRSRCKPCYQAASVRSKDYFKEKARKAQRYLEQRYTPKIRFQYACRMAKKRNLSWEISLDEYVSLISKGCHYCDKSILKATGSSLDRIDNALGYTSTNVLPACGECNVVRGSLLTVDEMRVVAQALKAYRRANGNS